MKKLFYAARLMVFFVIIGVASAFYKSPVTDTHPAKQDITGCGPSPATTVADENGKFIPFLHWWGH